MQKIRDNAWFQCAALTEKASKKIATANDMGCKQGDVLILVNQDCDILNPSYEKEPFAEFLLAEKIPGKPDPRYSKGKNSRLLHFRIGTDCYQARAHNRITVPRRMLEKEKPNPKFILDADTKDLIPYWIGKKYFRTAFPDEFNKRLEPALRKISKALKKDSDDIEELYILLDPMEELEEGAEYQVMLIATVSKDEISIIESVQDTVNKIAGDMNDCDGIKVRKPHAIRNKDVSLADIQEMDIWDVYDYLSVSDE